MVLCSVYSMRCYLGRALSFKDLFGSADSDEANPGDELRVSSSSVLGMVRSR